MNPDSGSPPELKEVTIEYRLPVIFLRAPTHESLRLAYGASGIEAPRALPPVFEDDFVAEGARAPRVAELSS
jgi:hypothetical protein